MFKKLHINIPFAEALEQMPSYAKFMKSILSRKVKLDDLETVALTEECSAILQQKLDKQFGKFLEVFKKLHINIPFAEALEQMPSYSKFMKGILSRKVKLDDLDTVALTEECSAML